MANQVSTLKSLASDFDKALTFNFSTIFHRFPEPSDIIKVVEFHFGTAMCLFLTPDCFQVFSFVQDSKVRSIDEYGFDSGCFYNPTTDKFFEA